MVLSDPPLVLPAESCVLLLPSLPELLPESLPLLLPPVAQIHTISMCMAARSKVEQDLHARTLPLSAYWSTELPIVQLLFPERCCSL